jgi:hypothetical protein
MRSRTALAIGLVQLGAGLCAGDELSSFEEYAGAIHATPNLEHGGQIFRNRSAPVAPLGLSFQPTTRKMLR